MRWPVFLTVVLLTASCTVPKIEPNLPALPKAWECNSDGHFNIAYKKTLTGWWRHFHDENLSWLIDQALKESPDFHQAQARIDEARGLQKSTFATLFPTISGLADVSRGKQLFLSPITGDSYNASFDASYELDLFGKNREASRASDYELQATLKDYDWVKLSLIAEISRTYISMRAAEKQIVLAEKNLAIQQETLDLVDRQHQAGGSSEFDVERTALLLNQSMARIADYKRQKEVFTLSLITLTGLTGAQIKSRIVSHGDIPGLDLEPIADAPACVIERRPDIVAANFRFVQATALKDSQVANFFPTISLSGLFGLSKTVLVSEASVWSVAGNASVSLLDFGRIQGQVDAASAREVQAYEAWRKSILQGLQDVETALTNTTRYHQQQLSLEKARANASKAVNLSQARYKQGDNSLLDVLDAQRQLVDADQALINAESSYVTSIIALYKALGQS